MMRLLNRRKATAQEAMSEIAERELMRRLRITPLKKFEDGKDAEYERVDDSIPGMRGTTVNQGPYYVKNYPVVNAEDEGLSEYFMNHKDVAGMAIGAGANGIDGPRRIVMNPYSDVLKTDLQKEGLVRIEAVRHAMDENNYKPSFKLSEHQKNLQKTVFKDSPYGSNDEAFKQSIISRILVGDADDLQPTPEQETEAARFIFSNDSTTANQKAFGGYLFEDGDMKSIRSFYDETLRSKRFDDGEGTKDTTPGMTGMMKATLATAAHFGNPTARRMTNYDTRSYTWPNEYIEDGIFMEPKKGNVYVASYDNLVTPQIQDTGKGLTFVNDVWAPENEQRSYSQSLKFNNEEDAKYFGEHYKEIAPMMYLYTNRDVAIPLSTKRFIWQRN